MKKRTTCSTFLMLPLVMIAGCAQGGKSSDLTAGASSAKGKQPARVKRTSAPRHVLRVAGNQTTKAGRGDPSLEDINRPAAWIYIDNRAGGFVETNGTPDPCWTIGGSVSATPTFKVEAFSALLGDPKDFACTLYSEEQAEGSKIAYSIKAKKRTFEVGKRYPLLSPGNDFVIRNLTTGDVVSQIPPLPAGTYVLAAGVKNLEMNASGLAMSRFKVGD